MFHHLKHKLRMVILDSAIDTWNEPRTRDLFHKIVDLKKKGYTSEYPAGITPLDAGDFVGTHIVICEESRSTGELNPIIAYKTIALDRCEAHRISFPATGILQTSKADVSPLSEIVEVAKQNRRGISYDGSWTMDQGIQKDKGYSKALRDVLTTIALSYHRDFEVPEWTVCGIKRFKTDLYFEWLGCKTFTDEFRFYALFDEPAVMLHLRQPSADALKVVEAHQSLWTERLVIAPPTADGLALPRVA